MKRRRNLQRDQLRRYKKRYRKTNTKTKEKEKKEKKTKQKDLSRYQITAIDTKSNKIQQPQGAKEGILPEHPFRMYVVGSSGSGKSNFILNLLTKKDMYHNYFDEILVISPTAVNLDPSYKVLNLPEENYFPCDENVLDRIMTIQEENIEGKDGDKSNAPKILLILDDIVSYKSFCNSKMMLKFAVMSRHWGISMMILSQAYHRIPKSVRMQMTVVIYFKGSNKEIEVLAEDFGAPGLSAKAFRTIIANTTSKRYDFFFVDTNRPVDEGRFRKNLSDFISIT